MKVTKSVFLPAVCLILLLTSVAQAEKQAPDKAEALKVMAEMQALEAKQMKVLNAAPSGTVQSELAQNAFRQTIKLRMSLEKFTGVTYGDLLEHALIGLTKEAQRVQQSGTPEEKEAFIQELEKLKQ